MSLAAIFSKELIRSRKAMHLTQENAAEILEISSRWYQMIESGKVLPGSGLLLKIFIVFEIDGKLLHEITKKENVVFYRSDN